MAHPRKKRRTQPPPPTTSNHQTPPAPPGTRTPKSMVIRTGGPSIGPTLTQLVHDTRSIMEPYTASKLRERRSNRLRDYITMAGPLGVSHLMLFSRGKESGNVNLRVAVHPRGPTLTFRVERYALCRDVCKSVKRPRGAGKAGGGRGGLEHLSPPLLVMNNFSPVAPGEGAAAGPGPGDREGKEREEDRRAKAKAVPRHLESLVTSTFQSLFPPISPQNTGLKGIRRVLLLNREQDGKGPEQQIGGVRRDGPPQHDEAQQNASSSDQGAYTLNLRHYAITTKQVHSGLSRGLKRLQRAQQHARARERKAQPGSGDAGAATNGISGSSLSNSGLAAAANAAAPTRRKQQQQKGALPDLGRLEDIADFLEAGYTSASGGYTSGSETEAEGTDAEVEILEPVGARKVINRRERERRRQEGRVRAEERRRVGEVANGTEDGLEGDGNGEEAAADNRNEESDSEAEAAAEKDEPPPRDKKPDAPSISTQKRTIHLTELGPRLKLRLLKVEEGLCTGKVMWHELYSRTAAEETALEKMHEGRRAEKEVRRREQRAAVEVKRGERAAATGKGKGGGRGGDEDVSVDGEMLEEGDDDDDLWDEEDDEMVEGL